MAKAKVVPTHSRPGGAAAQQRQFHLFHVRIGEHALLTIVSDAKGIVRDCRVDGVLDTSIETTRAIAKDSLDALGVVDGHVRATSIDMQGDVIELALALLHLTHADNANAAEVLQ